MEGLTQIYRDAGVCMIPTTPVSAQARSDAGAGRLILAPPSAAGSKWAKRFRGAETGFASGWMQIRGTRRRKGYDVGFVLSDHADWPGLIRTIEDSGARRVLATHGYTDALLAYLKDRGIDAAALATPYGEEEA
jgi:putative mRNA 3-end processing factor